jgi:hypothetical protein
MVNNWTMSNKTNNHPSNWLNRNNVEAHASVPPHSYAPGHVQKYVKFNQVMGSQLSLLLSTCFLNSLTGITNDHGYVPLVVNTSQSFPHSRLITGFVPRLTRRVPLLEQELLTLPHEFNLGFYWGSCYSIFSFICMFFRSLFVLLYFFFSQTFKNFYSGDLWKSSVLYTCIDRKCKTFLIK